MTTIRRLTFSIALAAALSATAWAQPATIRSVRAYTVKPDRVGDFQAAIKEYNAILVKAGASVSYNMWHSLTGPNEYVRVDNFSTWAGLDSNPLTSDPKLKDQVANLRVIADRINACVESSRRAIEEVIPELSLGSPGVTSRMIRVLQTTVKPDKTEEFLDLYRKEVLPAVKKAAPNFYSVAQVRYGSASSEFVSVISLDHWAELDGGFGVQKVMGKEGYAKFLAKITPLLVGSHYEIYSFMPDLSYIPAAK